MLSCATVKAGCLLHFNFGNPVVQPSQALLSQLMLARLGHMHGSRPGHTYHQSHTGTATTAQLPGWASCPEMSLMQRHVYSWGLRALAATGLSQLWLLMLCCTMEPKVFHCPRMSQTALLQGGTYSIRHALPNPAGHLHCNAELLILNAAVVSQKPVTLS